MSIKQLQVEGIGQVVFQKRRGTRSVRIHIQGHSIRVTLPHWVSYHEALKFVQSRQSWIKTHKLERHIVANGALIGKKYFVSITHQDLSKPKTRIIRDIVRIQLPMSLDVTSDVAQQAIERACERALAAEANELLTPRLHDLAYEHQFTYKSLRFKKLKRRWGSCDSQGNIVLNIFLTQLPWEYIDYVLLHELTHTQHLHHGVDFWQKLEEVLPDAKELRKKMREFHPQLLPH